MNFITFCRQRWPNTAKVFSVKCVKRVERAKGGKRAKRAKGSERAKQERSVWRKYKEIK